MNSAFLSVLSLLIRIVATGPLLWMFYFLHFQNEGSGAISEAMLNVLLFVSFAALHSLMARDVTKAHLAKVGGKHFVRVVYVSMAGISLSLLLMLWQPLSGTLWSAHGLLYWALSILYLGCIAGMIYTSSMIDYLDFIGIRPLLRRVNNCPDKPPVFSLRGPYAYVRHPTYLLLLIALWVGPVMTYGRLEFVALGSLYLIVGTFLEERNLRDELGEVYDVYRGNVPMWIPRLSPWRYE